MKAKESRVKVKAEPPSFLDVDLFDDFGNSPIQIADANDAAITLPCIFCITSCQKLASAKEITPPGYDEKYNFDLLSPATPSLFTSFAGTTSAWPIGWLPFYNSHTKTCRHSDSAGSFFHSDTVNPTLISISLNTHPSSPMRFFLSIWGGKVI